MPNSLQRRPYRFVSALFLAAALASSGYVVQASSRQADQPQAQSQSQEPVAIVDIFTGKILSQNGDLLILRDDANNIWYHLDDQQQAKKFLGKNVSVTGTLDASTDTIRVRSIFEGNS